jgi:hypothetical protein
MRACLRADADSAHHPVAKGWAMTELILKYGELAWRLFQYRRPRYVADFAFWVQAEGEQEHICGHCHNIGYQGLGADLQTTIAAGRLVDIIIPLETGTNVRIRSRVTSVDEVTQGFQFLPSTEADRKTIDYVLRMATKGRLGKFGRRGEP